MTARKASPPARGKKPDAPHAQPRSGPEDIKNYKQSLALANRLNKVAPDEDNAVVAGAIVLFAAEVIKRSSANAREARAYLEGMRSAIDGLITNAFQDAGEQAKVTRRR